MKYLNLIILLLFLLACQDKKKDEIKHLVSEWQGKEIRFPKDMVFARFATDTVDFTLPKSPHKVLVFVDSIGCTSCKLQLHRWKELIQYTDSITQGTVPFLFFFQSDDKKEIRYLLKKDNFDKPICLDQSDKLNELNHFPADGRFQTFLLDKYNKVVVIGNPIHKPEYPGAIPKRGHRKTTRFTNTDHRESGRGIHTARNYPNGRKQRSCFPINKHRK